MTRYFQVSSGPFICYPADMAEFKRMAVALTIAGSDSGGGAGLQADLKTFAALGVHGASAVTCLTAQNPRRILALVPCSPALLRQQILAVWEELPPAAVKTGLLASAAQVRLLVEVFKSRPGTPLVIDPVMISTSGTRLLPPAARTVLLDELLPLATLVTPNLDEAGRLIGRPLASVDDLRIAAREIHARFGCAALVKGGHLPRTRTAADIYYDGETELFLSAPFVRGLTTHGTGCTYSAAITAGLADGLALPEAVTRAKHFITRAIAGSRRMGRHFVLGYPA
jgi:hydroxymethylpyrimidine/phosphomethylpyrimidine kinase